MNLTKYVNIESQSNVQYFTKASGTHCDVKDMVEGVYYRVRCRWLLSTGSAAPTTLGVLSQWWYRVCVSR
jgi:hypothetical protein